ncbi:MAG: glycosyltransferase family 4 protein [Pseudomonadota bacterium]
MRILLAAPNIDGTDVGEAFVAFKWAQALSDLVELTVLGFERPGREPLARQLPGARVVSWPEPAWLRGHERLNAMAKPGYPVWSARVASWLRGALAAGEQFDVAHQIMPQAARYPSPFRHFDLPYIIGPLGGALETPPAFRHETGGAPLFTRLRALDRLRFRHDPWLRESYARAAMVLGVAPYVREVLADMPIRRFEPVLELGIDAPAPHVPRAQETGSLRLLHVGRGVRTKGLRDVVRALALLRDLPDVTLTSAGAGEEIARCRAEAERLGVAGRVRFLGQLPREAVEELYQTHDVFSFPSFREPAGGVLYEAMRWGLPVVTAARGGPDWIVDEASGIRLPISSPDALGRNLAASIRKLADEPALRARLGRGAREKVTREGLWPVKARAMVAHYQSVRKPIRAAA